MGITSSTPNIVKKRNGGYAYRVLVVGTAGVGKTSLMERICDGTFIERGWQGIGGDIKTTSINYRNDKVTVDFWEYMFYGRYKSIFRATYGGANVILLLFDLGHADSFQGLSYWKEQIETYGATGVTVFLVGNKSDLKERGVSYEEASQFARNIGWIYFETSCKKGYNVNQLFLTILERLKCDTTLVYQ